MSGPEFRTAPDFTAEIEAAIANAPYLRHIHDPHGAVANAVREDNMKAELPPNIILISQFSPSPNVVSTTDPVDYKALLWQGVERAVRMNGYRGELDHGDLAERYRHECAH